MDRVIGLCIGCPNAADANNRCCTQSVMPSLSVNHYDAFIEQQKVVFDLTFWNYERFIKEVYLERY